MTKSVTAFLRIRAVEYKLETLCTGTPGGTLTPCTTGKQPRLSAQSHGHQIAVTASCLHGLRPSNALLAN
jgi:hypothetical protein